MSEKQRFLLFAGLFGLLYLLPADSPRVKSAFPEGLFMLTDYARLHVILCLVPALFIAGAISSFIQQGAVMRYLGAGAPKPMAYGVAATSGSILAVCSCTVLPLFAGIYRRGAGLGPATAFLYSGPAINVLAMILTARVLGLKIGLARAIGAVGFAFVIGLLMAAIFRKEDAQRLANGPDPFATAAAASEGGRHGWQDGLVLGLMVAALVFANWGTPNRQVGLFAAVWAIHWPLAAGALVALAPLLARWYSRAELAAWMASTWDFAKQILPLLFGGVLVTGWLMGRPGGDSGLIPSAWIAGAVGGNSLVANFAAALVGAFMYFATLTEVPILQGLLGSGMGNGPALALLLAGPALSLPSMIVIKSYLGWRKTVTYVGLVVLLSTVCGLAFGALA